MGFTLIKGAFHLDAGDPDGDSVRFKADDDRQFESLRGRRVEFKTDGTVQLRYEGIDTIEKAAIQPLAMEWTHATKTLSSYERVMMLCLALLAVSSSHARQMSIDGQ